MKYDKDKYFYVRNLKISFVLSLLIIITAFLMLPDFKINQKDFSYYEEPVIKLIEIPQTQLTFQARATPVQPRLSVFIEEPEILSDIILPENETGNVSSEQLMNRETQNKKENSESIIFFPQQTLEILPANQKIKGIIKLELLIDKNGEVKNCKILSTTIKQEDKISEIIDAALKSKWQPMPNGKEYLIEKVYQFN